MKLKRILLVIAGVGMRFFERDIRYRTGNGV